MFRRRQILRLKAGLSGAQYFHHCSEVYSLTFCQAAVTFLPRDCHNLHWLLRA